jgi:uncharacterized membrane protein (UPF0136 family)
MGAAYAIAAALVAAGMTNGGIARYTSKKARVKGRCVRGARVSRKPMPR